MQLFNQAFQWDARDRPRARKHAPNMTYALVLSRAQNLKQHDDESQDSDNESEELEGNWDDLIVYD